MKAVDQTADLRLWAILFLIVGSLASYLLGKTTDGMADFFLIVAAAGSLSGAAVMLWLAAKVR